MLNTNTIRDEVTNHLCGLEYKETGINHLYLETLSYFIIVVQGCL